MSARTKTLLLQTTAFLIATLIWLVVMNLIAPWIGAPSIFDSPVYYATSFVVGILASYGLRWTLGLLRRQQTLPKD